MFQILTDIPQELLTCESAELLKVLGRPTLLKISGQKQPPLFLSALLHGNEATGLKVFQQLAQRYGTQEWPRSVYFFFGNVWAAQEKKRRLDHQPDFNRIWRSGDLPENQMAMALIDVVNPASLFAAIDIHNNVGRNPLYPLLEHLEVKHLNLAALFADQCLYFDEPEYTLSETFGRFCPAVTIECGLSGEAEGVARTVSYIEQVMSLDDMPSTPVSQLNLTVLNALGTLKIDPQSSIGVGGEDGDIQLDAQFDLMNFRQMPSGTEFARYKGDHRLRFFDGRGQDVTDTYFEHKAGKVISRVSLVPTMLKMDKHGIHTNCLGYVMKPVTSN